MKKTNKFFAIIAVLALVLIVCVSFVACNNKEDVGTVKKVSVRYVADGAAAAMLLSGGQVDFIVVGEPPQQLKRRGFLSMPK